MLFIRAVNELECNSEDTSEDTETFISNPLAAYQLVRKLNKVWSITREVLEEQNIQGLRGSADCMNAENRPFH